MLMAAGTQEQVVTVPLEQLAHEINQLHELREQCASRAGYWRQKCGEYDKDIEVKQNLVMQHARNNNPNPQKSAENLQMQMEKLTSEQPKVGKDVKK